MQIIPVLDLLGGVVVRGVQGRREEYRPVESRIVQKSDPLSVARSFRDRFGLTRLYVADLDAIVHQQQDRDVYRMLAANDFQLMVDAGLRNIEGAEALLAEGADQVVAGLETWPGPDQLARLAERLGGERVVFSLDMKSGKPFGDLSGWPAREPYDIAVCAVEAGAGELIVLDLAQVGANAGLSTENLCRRLIDRFPQLRVITGGGVRGLSDLKRLSRMKVSGALVASALHDGRISRADIESLAGLRKKRVPGVTFRGTGP